MELDPDKPMTEHAAGNFRRSEFSGCYASETACGKLQACGCGEFNAGNTVRRLPEAEAFCAPHGGSPATLAGRLRSLRPLSPRCCFLSPWTPPVFVWIACLFTMHLVTRSIRSRLETAS